MPKQTTPAGSGTAKAGSDPQELSIGDILRIFSHRIPIILVVTLFCLLLAIAYFVVAVNKYTATATIEINKDNSMSLGLDDLSGIGSKLGTGADLLTDMMTHEEDLENESTALDTIKRLNLLSTAPFAMVPGEDKDLDNERGTADRKGAVYKITRAEIVQSPAQGRSDKEHATDHGLLYGYRPGTRLGSGKHNR